MKRPDLLVPVFHRLVSCSGFRQIAYEFGVSPQTIGRISGRLGRHSLLLHQLKRPKGQVQEPLALDSFESFEYSQYFPTSYHVVAGQRTHFFFGFTESERRRRGNMTSAQKKRRAWLEERLGKPDPKSVEKEVAALLAIVAPIPQSLEIYTDEHHAYPRAVLQVPHLSIAHRTISSRAARTPQNPLFAINLLDLKIRHNGANHKRETIAFSKRRASAAYRLAHFLIWRNWVRPFSERKGGPSPAMRLGLIDRLLTVPELLKRRLFPSRIALPERWQDYYFKEVPTRAVPKGTTHRLRYAG